MTRRRLTVLAVTVLVAVATSVLVADAARRPVERAAVPRGGAPTAVRAPKGPSSLPEPRPERVGRGRSREFTEGACRAWPALGQATGRTVYLDAGHGGRDPGAVVTVAGGPVEEEDLALAIVRTTRSTLQAAGFRVVVARESDEGVARLREGSTAGKGLSAAGVKRELEARNVCANVGRADIALSVHLNSASDPGVRGPQTIYNDNRRYRVRNRALAGALHAAVGKALTEAGLVTSDQGITKDEDVRGGALTPQGAAYGQLLQLGPASPPWFRAPTRMPAVLLELLHLTSPEDLEIARSPAGRAALAAGITDGVRDAVGIAG